MRTASRMITLLIVITRDMVIIGRITRRWSPISAAAFGSAWS
ncbi:hypothetical protein [Candidatus Laterigemmans baculatus]|nr:hypothetical protein [Candidatus Laterigemmans baculatus]